MVGVLSVSLLNLLAIRPGGFDGLNLLVITMVLWWRTSPEVPAMASGIYCIRLRCM